MQVNQSGPTCAVLSLKSRENSLSISVKTRSNTNLVASRVRIGKRTKFLLTSLERLLCDKFCGQRRWCCYATVSLGKHNEGYSCICHNVNTQNVKKERCPCTYSPCNKSHIGIVTANLRRQAGIREQRPLPNAELSCAPEYCPLINLHVSPVKVFIKFLIVNGSVVEKL